MGSLIPVLVAFLLNSFGIYLFIDPKLSGCGPYMSMLIFNFAVFILLLDVRLHPTSMRKLGPCFSHVMQFFVATILTEHLVSDFWLPLEEDTMHLLPKIAEIEAELLKQGGFECETITEFLKQEQTQIAASYILSLYFLLSVMHATRVVDIRLLRCSPKVFFQDIMVRAKATIRKYLRILAGCGPRCVKWTEDDDDEEEEDSGCDAAFATLQAATTGRHASGNHRGGTRSRHRKNRS